MPKIVIDTSVWDKAFLEEFFDPDCSRIRSLIATDETYVMILDNQNEIMSEYRHLLGGEREFEIFLMRLENELRVEWVDQKIDSEHLKKLIELKFHEPSDRAFVFTAMAADRLIVTEDSDYGVMGINEQQRRVFEYMKAMMGLHVYNSKGYLALA